MRLPFSIELFATNPVITNTSVLAANPALLNRTAVEIFDAVVKALTDEKLMVVLNNHVSTATWCCSDSDGEGLWYTQRFGEKVWVNLWLSLARHYRSNSYVIAADLRNELRPANGISPTWGDQNSTTDWRRAATMCGNAILQLNPSMLIVVEGLDYATDLTAVAQHPIVLVVANKLVYSAHCYSWQQSSSSYAVLERYLNDRWGYLSTNNVVWLGEFGTDSQSNWWD